MAGDIDGAEAVVGAQAQADEAAVAQQQAAAEPMTDTAADATGAGDGYERALVERDARIAELEAQVADAVKSAEAAEGLRAEIAEVRARAEADRVEYELRLAGARNVKAATALLDDHSGDVAALKGGGAVALRGRRGSQADREDEPPQRGRGVR